MTERAVAVTGMGIVSPAGSNVERNWNRVCSGTPTAMADPALIGGPVTFSCRISDFDVDCLPNPRQTRRLDRFAQLALVAANDALADAGIDTNDWNGSRVAVVIGNGAGGQTSLDDQYRILEEKDHSHVSSLLLPMFLPNMVAGQISLSFGITGPAMIVGTACASGADAIGIARELLNSGRCDIALAGGTEVMLTPMMVAGFARMKVLSTRNSCPTSASRPFDRKRDGLVLSEGAGILVLERWKDADARRARIHGILRGYGASSDAHHVTTPEPRGLGLERAIKSALEDAEIGSSAVKHVNAHGTSTRLNDVIEAQVLSRVFGQHTSVTSTKGVTGHTFGAAGAIEAIFTILTLQRGLIPPTANLTELDPDVDLDVVAGVPRVQEIDTAVSNSMGFGGHNSALVFTRM